MFDNNTFVAAYRRAREYASDLTDRVNHLGEEHVLGSFMDFETHAKMELRNLDETVRAYVREENDRVMWTCLLRACNDRIRIVSMNLFFWGKPEWRCEEVVEAISFVAAVVDNTTEMISGHVVVEIEGMFY